MKVSSSSMTVPCVHLSVSVNFSQDAFISLIFVHTCSCLILSENFFVFFWIVNFLMILLTNVHRQTLINRLANGSGHVVSLLCTVTN